MRHAHVRHQPQNLAAQMRGGAVAAGAERNLVGPRPREVDQLAHAAYRQRRMHHQHIGRGHQLNHRRQIAQRVIRQLAYEARCGSGAGGSHHQRVTVGRGFGHDIGADHRAAAGAIVHVDLLPPRLGQFLRHQPRENVGGAAGRERGDQAYWFRRVGLCVQHAGCQAQCCKQGKSGDSGDGFHSSAWVA